jgi:vesicular inhibitory amino acid transporter
MSVACCCTRTHNLLVLLGRTFGHEQSAVARSAAQHCRWRWLVASLFVVAYSWLISMFLPYFSSLVGIVASSTYLVGALTSSLQSVNSF